MQVIHTHQQHLCRENIYAHSPSAAQLSRICKKNLILRVIKSTGPILKNSPKYPCVVSNHSMIYWKETNIRTVLNIYKISSFVCVMPSARLLRLLVSSPFHCIIIITHFLRLTHSMWIIESETLCILRALDRAGHSCSRTFWSLLPSLVYGTKSTTICHMMHSFSSFCSMKRMRFSVISNSWGRRECVG